MTKDLHPYGLPNGKIRQSLNTEGSRLFEHGEAFELRNVNYPGMIVNQATFDIIREMEI